MFLVDSDVLIAHLRGVPAARDWLVDTRRAHGRLTASQISAVELRGGMRSDERSSVSRLLESLTLLDVDDRVARQAGDFQRQFRRSNVGIGLGDYLIAATAQVHELSLATLNRKHFPMFPDLAAPFTL